MDPKPYIEVIRAELVLARERLGWTRAQVAVELGVDQQTVWSWEKGTHFPGVPTLIRWADLLGRDVGLIPRDGGDS